MTKDAKGKKLSLIQSHLMVLQAATKQTLLK